MTGQDKDLSFNREEQKILLQTGLDQHRAGAQEAAIILYRRCLILDPDNFDAHHLLGIALHETGESDAGRLSIQEALVQRPNAITARYSLARLDQDRGFLAAAARGYRTILAVDPYHIAVHINFGQVLLDQGILLSARKLLCRATELAPQNPETWAGLGNVLGILGQWREAQQAFIKASQIDPKCTVYHVNLGCLAARLGDSKTARYCYQKAVQICPTDPTALIAWGQMLQAEGREKQARQFYRRGQSTGWNPILAFNEAFCLPVIQDSVSTIAETRHRVEEALDQLLDPPLRFSPLPLEQLLEQMGQTLFYLAYHGCDDRRLHEKAGQALRRLCPDLVWAAPGLDLCTKRENSTNPIKPKRTIRQIDTRIQVGIISRHLYGHTIGHLNRGLIEYLPRDRFCVTLFHLPGPSDVLAQKLAQSADHLIKLPAQLGPARRLIAETQMDILYYPDIGMEPFTGYLAQARLAPLQSVSWGHPVTTGLPEMDLFLSGADFEDQQAQMHYSERLIRLTPSVPYIYPPEVLRKPPTPVQRHEARAALGLPEQGRLYLCPQSLFKLHPDFDIILTGILEKDTKASILLLEGSYPYWKQYLQRRFARTMPAHHTRIQFLKRLWHSEFLLLLRAVDCLLDPPHFCGGKSSLEIFAAGCAVVTWPGSFLRSRLTYGFYRMMEIDEACVQEATEYIRFATELANNPDRRLSLEQQIYNRRSILFENKSGIENVATVWEESFA